MGIVTNKDILLGRSVLINQTNSITKFNIYDIDELLQKSILLLNNTEIIRCNFVITWNTFLKQTGAIVISTPSFESGINGLLIALAISLLNNNNSQLYNNISFQKTFPFINITNPHIYIEPKVQDIMQSFISLCDFAKNNNEIVNELNEEFNQLLLKGMIVSQLRNYNDYFRKKNVKECDIELYGKKLKEYIRRIKNGYYCLNIIKNRINEFENVLTKYINIINNENDIVKYSQIALQCKQQCIYEQNKVMLKFSNENTLSSLDICRQREIVYEKIMSNAKECLSRMNGNKIEKQNCFTKELTPIHFIDKLHLIEEKYFPGFENEFWNALSCDKCLYISDLQIMVIGLSTGNILIYKLNKSTFTLIQIIKNKHNNCHITFLLNTLPNNMLFSSLNNGELYLNVFDLNKKRFNSELVMNDTNNTIINCMCDLCNGLYIAIGTNELLGCFDYIGKKMLFTFKAHDNQISKIIYNHNNDLLISCDKSSYIKFWTLSEQKCIHVFSPKCNINTSITDIMFHEINSTLNLITVSYNGMIRIYNINTKETITTYTIPDKCIKLIDLGTHNDFISLHNDKDILFSLIANNTSSYTTHMNINNTNNNFIEGFYLNNAKDIIILTKNLYYQIWSTCK